MAFFKFRKRGDDASASQQPPPAESAEAMRRRARQRLIGAAVLVLAAVIGFPLVFDTQPRPIAVDIPIDIPDRAKAKPLAAPGTPVAPTAAGALVVADASPAPASVKADALAAPAAVPAAVAVAAPPVAAVASAPAKPASSPLEAKADPEADARFVVQVGAFAEPAKAIAARQKLEKAGLKTYTHVAETKDGKRTRVRVGPFATKAEADKAAAKVKGLDLPAAVLTL